MAQREKGRKSHERKQGTRTARGKRKWTGSWTETEKKKQQGHRKRHRKSRAQKDRSGQWQSGDGGKHFGWSTGQKGIGIWAGSGTNGQTEKQQDRMQGRATDQNNDNDRERERHRL